MCENCKDKEDEEEKKKKGRVSLTKGLRNRLHKKFYIDQQGELEDYSTLIDCTK